jgi:hypothetical protein
VLACLATLRSQLVSKAAHQKASSSAISLLPFCSDRQLLTEHTVNILTDVTSGFRDLIGKLSSNAEFESEIAQLLGQDAEKVRGFWREEYVAE